jgi:ATP-dependent DNA ligase
LVHIPNHLLTILAETLNHAAVDNSRTFGSGSECAAAPEWRFGSPRVLSRVHWVKPKLVAEVTYLTWADGLLRHTVYVGLREDKPATDVRRESA